MDHRTSPDLCKASTIRKIYNQSRVLWQQIDWGISQAEVWVDRFLPEEVTRGVREASVRSSRAENEVAGWEVRKRRVQRWFWTRTGASTEIDQWASGWFSRVPVESSSAPHQVQQLYQDTVKRQCVLKVRSSIWRAPTSAEPVFQLVKRRRVGLRYR